MRKFSIFSMAMLFLLFAVNAQAKARPNILLLVAEDLSPRLNSFGDSLAQTPNLDALASNGVRFDQVFATAGVCAPSRAALITGVHQNSFGAGHMRASDGLGGDYLAVPPHDLKAFPELLRAAGYYTYVNDKLDYQFSGTQPGSGPFTIWDQESSLFSPVSWRDRPAQRPFFGMYNFMETHESGLFPRCCWPRSGLHALMAAMQIYRHWGEPSPVSEERVSVPPYYPDTPAVRRDIARQYNNIATMDRRVGEIMTALQREALLDSTIVIWLSDHGDGLPRAKRELFDSGLHVPMIIYWPEAFRPGGLSSGQVDSRLISFVDLAPTILTMACVAPPAFMHGQDFLDRGHPPRRYIYAAKDRMDEVEDRQRAVRDHRYKYIRNYQSGRPGAQPLAFRDYLGSMQSLWAAKWKGELNAEQAQWFAPRPPEELYDTQLDPHEVRNIASLPAYRPILLRMRQALDHWQREVPDMGSLNESEMAERFWPGGQAPITAKPELEYAAAKSEVRIVAGTQGASVGYRVNDGRWLLYRDPVPVKAGDRVASKSVRYGWRESPMVELVAP